MYRVFFDLRRQRRHSRRTTHAGAVHLPRSPGKFLVPAVLPQPNRATLWSHGTQFPAEVESVPRTRHFVCTHLIDHRFLYLVEDVRLVVSELATNAVRHANTPFAVTLSQVDQSVLLTVTDGSPALPVRLARDVLDTGGRGLSIVDLVCRDWGVTRLPGEAKSVWASFALRVDLRHQQGRHA
ncbi:MAG TPA: ATP-binding protein [Nocardioidaceae bacterium]|nr:ATP-binding protein [Nocardioidaceae bacterium]